MLDSQSKSLWIDINWLASWQVDQGTKSKVDNVDKVYIFKYTDHKHMQRYELFLQGFNCMFYHSQFTLSNLCFTINIELL
jgi:hypothetical protein